MPVNELKKYRGISANPDDSEFKCTFAKCYDLYFTGTNGARVYSKFLVPKEVNGKIPALLEFHGYQGSSKDWSEALKYVSSGMCVAMMDVRGQAGKSQDVGGTDGFRR